MIKLTLKDGSVKELAAPMSAGDVAKEISMGLYRSACAAHIDGKLCDLRALVDHDCRFEVLTFEDEDGRWTFNHTASHMLAEAVQHLFPQAKFAIGPAIDDGFYYDFDIEKPFTAEDLTRLEEEMAKIAKESQPLERFELDVPEALALMKDQPYKEELLQEHAGKGEKISFYRQGDFTDLCAGPHLMDTSPVKAVKLLSCTGAYWRGSEKNKMLSRVYGIAFPKKSMLEEYLAKLEDAKKRDHNKIGRELGYFTTCDIIGQGLPLLCPKGAKLFQILNRYVQDLEEYEYGYLMTRTPLMAKSDLYKQSGHWDHYKDGMFVLGEEGKDKEVFALRPMTCPFQYHVYMSQMHSYRDLPLRYGETSTLFRNEASGEMHGLIRVRQFTISEGHLILRPDQLEDEFRKCVELIQRVMGDIGLLDDLTYRFSKWDPNDREKYIGTPEQWNEAEGLMRKILDDIGLNYVEKSGEAAFYGPKLDVQMKNVFGKEDTLCTVQVDLMLARQYDMTYVDKDGSKKFPYIIHRTSLGCYERTIALLLEKYAGALPLWLSPEQVRVLPIGDAQMDYARSVNRELIAHGLRSHLDESREKIGYKIRQAQMEKIPYMLVVGDKEMAAGEVAVRARRDGDRGAMPLAQFMQTALDEVAKKVKE